MNGTPEPVGTIEVALSHAGKLLESEPALAAEQAREILKAAPSHPLATLFIGIAQRRLGDAEGALEILQPLARAQPGWAPAHYELGVTLGLVRRGDEAVQSLRRAVRLKPDIGDAWRLLGDHLTAMGDRDGADAAYANHIKVSTRDPRLLVPAAALCENRIPEAELLLKQHLKQFPTDVAAIRMLAEVAARLGRLADAETLLARCLELAPGFVAARNNYALVLHRQNRTVEALEQIDRLLAVDPRNPGTRNLKAAALNRIGEYEQSLGIYEEVLAEYPQQAKVWMSYGHALKTAGRQPESVDAYRRTIELSPQFGEAWWSLANLKTFRFTPAEVEVMREQLARTDLSAEDRFHFHFALGKALEDARDFARSFEHYAEGNRLRHAAIHYDADRTSASVRRSRELFSADFLAERAGAGAPAADPIFIVGLPRAGSTLVEQILASHSLVEGTMELPDIDGHRAEPHQAPRNRRIIAVPGGRGTAGPRAIARPGRTVPGADAHPAQDGRAVLHRQDAEQLGLHRPDPADPAEREDHRRAAPSAELLLLRLQAAFCPRTAFLLQPRRHRPVLPRLRRTDGPLRCGAAGTRPPGRL